MSRLVVIGLSHHTAPIEVREEMAISGDALGEQLRRLLDVAPEAMVLSTCNRYELYLAAPDEATCEAAQAVVLQGRTRARAYLYRHHDEAALRHLFRVAASLDSLVLGEPQILGQVKHAYEAARQVGAIGPLLGRTVPRAFAVAKRVRSETRIGEHAASVASVAVELAGHIFGSLAGRPVLLVGAGKMAELAARHLRQAQVGQLWVVNRTRARANELAVRLGGTAHDFTELEALLGEADVVLCSTGASEPVLRADLLARVMRARRGRWLLLVDIAVPRDVEPRAGKLENVYLYDIDALRQVVEQNRRGRLREAEAAERIIEEELRRFIQSERQRELVPTIRALREWALSLARTEARRTLGRLSPGANERDRQLVAQLAEAVVNKLLHVPLSTLKREASDPGRPAPRDLDEALRRLFALDEAVQEAGAVEEAPRPREVEPLREAKQ
ncbi:MAG: glutamyl-tRNA reductase [Myxococcales bacterium]|nr:glutamyl-tRNA reductase [Myxococcota bacterium]MDW8283566.1 glutamyl-tRNA reductase [Myxococcales bacterium]